MKRNDGASRKISAVLLSVLMGGCAISRAPTVTEMDARIDAAVSTTIQAWGLPAGHPWSVKAREQVRIFFADPVVRDTVLSKAGAVFAKELRILANEGFQFLDPKMQRAWLLAELEMISGGTDEECQAYVRTARSHSPSPIDQAVIRHRLSRASEAEFFAV